ncbi:2-oxoglutarate synthase subunit alpha [candidate division bacterium WOR-3 4484_18]|uniref:2-oxoglutarate synthase subunit alpha n=1 Tax=candidate division WOR-3 bacterium 4484_18 TaxID=2020626 RepID=A0A257LVA3_UNCW3|nr:MAG: 2-oxoglutarate synthase subunit alpha [candidate division bacterium WOR-3 4484_18]
MSNRRVLTGTHFWQGDIACAEGGIAAGCNVYAGYPITPSSEVMEHMARRLPEVDGIFIQMEDEIASAVTIIGASWAGAKAMTATSGPGISLMMEMMETPVVLINVQRGGPSTGLPTLWAQQDVMQARWGSHGDYEVIAIAPNSPQEMFDLTIEAFNLAEMYRVPVIVLSDAIVGHMTEKVVVPPVEDLVNKIRNNADKIIKIEEHDTEDADVIVIAYGITARVVIPAIRKAKSHGVRVGLLRPITIWPFPEKRIVELNKYVGGWVMVELNCKQLYFEVGRLLKGDSKLAFVGHPGGGLPSEEEIYNAIMEVAK